MRLSLEEENKELWLFGDGDCILLMALGTGVYVRKLLQNCLNLQLSSTSNMYLDLDCVGTHFYLVKNQY